jgi:uncharacterized damage-inducible protein DinB
MKFEFNRSLEILERTPDVLYALLKGISDDWIFNNEGPGTWSVFDIVGHLIVCEKTDFISRTRIILSDAGDKVFAPIDMFAQFEVNEGKSMFDLLVEFELLRKKNIRTLLELDLSEDDFQKTGLHPVIGKARLNELLSTWVAHDLTHTAQITRVMAKQYKEATGPFIRFLRVLQS